MLRRHQPPLYQTDYATSDNVLLGGRLLRQMLDVRLCVCHTPWTEWDAI